MTMTKTTLAEQAYQELRERIISGRLPTLDAVAETKARLIQEHRCRPE